MLKRPQPARLLAVDREAVGTRLLLLGRDDATVGKTGGLGLQVADPSVADRHAVIRYARGRYYVSDLKSVGGTFLNGRRIRRTQPLKHGDNLRFGGGVPYRFIDPDALRRRHERHLLRALAVIAAIFVIGLVDHFAKLNLFSLATLTEIAALTQPRTAAKRVDVPKPALANAPTRPASIAGATNVSAAIHLAGSSAPTLNVSASPPTSPTAWLDRINFYRAGVGVAEIHDNPELSASVVAHAHYLLANFADEIRGAKPLSSAAYEEDAGKSGYTATGATAAQNVQLAWGCTPYDAASQIDHWISAPLHRLAMLNPFLSEAGFGEAMSNGCWVAAILLPPPAEEVKPYARAVEFPPDGASMALDWISLDSPDPLASCPGYERPAGLPITVQLGRRVETGFSAHSLMENGKPVEHCAFDAKSYLNENPAGQEYGRWNLRNSGAVVIVPRAPLKPGSRYTVSIIANDQTYAWNFTAAATASTFAAIAKFPVSATPLPIAAPVSVAEIKPAIAASPRAPRIARPSHRAIPEARGPSIASIDRDDTIPPSAPTPEESAGTSSTSMNWLTVLNAYRARLNVPPVAEDPILSRGDLAHAKYLVTNYQPMLSKGVNIGVLLHTEDESKPGYSPEGLKAGRASDVMYQSRINRSEAERMAKAIEWWISGPFHRAPIVNPELRQVGFAEYCAGTVCVAALNVVSDLTLGPYGGRQFAEPIEVPPDGVTIKPREFKGEWPDPLSACNGYSTLALAITLQLGMHVPAKVTGASLTQTTGDAAGARIETCAYDSDGYTNPDSVTQAKGRQALDSFGEVVMIVRNPLAIGESYRVAMTVNGKPYSWSFTAAP